MTPWTQSDLNAYQARQVARSMAGLPTSMGDAPTPARVNKEDELHDAIESYCLSQGWLYVHSRMDKRSTNQCGTPDFIVALPGGVTLWCEVKRGKSTKLTIEQQAFGAWLTKLGHRTVVARSLEDFVRATKESFTDMMVKAT